MSSKKNNFLPLLLIGGGAAAAALLYGVGTKKDKEEFAVVDGVGTVGSGDFLASSGVSKGYDSVDLGIEDYANNRATADAFGLPSDGANPEKVYDDAGEWDFADLATNVAVTAGVMAAPSAYKAVKNTVTKTAAKVGSSTVSQAAKSVGTRAATTVASTAARTGLTSALRLAGPVGAVAGGILALTGVATAADDVQFNEQEIFQISQNVSTDLAAKVGIGNMVTDNQLAHASGLSGAKYPISLASKEESALVNSAVGLSSGDVLKVSGSKFTSYVPEQGMQVTFSSGGTLQQAVDAINKAKRS